MKLRFAILFVFATATAHAQTTAANGTAIPHPTSTATYAVGNVNVPQGMVYIPAGNFTWSTGAIAAMDEMGCINEADTPF